MSVTALVFQLPTTGDSAIDEQPLNMKLMLVTALVFQLPTDGGFTIFEQL
jgi:hypothetical protein